MPRTLDHAAVRRVVAAAAKKGVDLDITVFDESTHTAEEAARAVGAELGQIVKSLVFVSSRDDGSLEPILCLVSGPNRVDVSRLAAVLARPDVRRATAREANTLTGYTIGGIPPIGHERRIRVIMDPDLGRYETVWAAAGLSTALFPVTPATLRMLSDANVAPITEEPAPADAPTGDVPDADGAAEGRGAAAAEVPAAEAPAAEVPDSETRAIEA